MGGEDEALDLFELRPRRHYQRVKAASHSARQSVACRTEAKAQDDDYLTHRRPPDCPTKKQLSMPFIGQNSDTPATYDHRLRSTGIFPMSRRTLALDRHSSSVFSLKIQKSDFGKYNSMFFDGAA